MKRHILIVAASLIALAGCSKTGTTTATQQAQGTQSGIDLAAIDKSVKPGDDFDKYANGTWERTAEIPADKSNIGVFSLINDTAQKREADLVQDIVKSNPTPGSDEARIANYYNAFMDTGAIEKRGLTPVKADIARIQAIGHKGARANAIGRPLAAGASRSNGRNFHTETPFGIAVPQA